MDRRLEPGNSSRWLRNRTDPCKELRMVFIRGPNLAKDGKRDVLPFLRGYPCPTRGLIYPPIVEKKLRFASPSLSPGRISSTWSNWLSLTHSVPHLVSPRSIRVSFQSNVDSNPSEPESFPFQPGRERKPKWEKGVEASIRIRVLRFATHACFGPQRGSCATKRRGKERHACVFARDLACGSTRPPHATEPEDGGGVVRRTSLGCGFQGGCKLPIASEWNHCL